MIQLVKRSISGDADAFLELMEKNSLAMYKVARGILDNDEDAADAIQDTILTCFEKIHTLKNPEYFKTWMISAIFSLAAYTVILCFSLFKSGALAKSIFSAH